MNRKSKKIVKKPQSKIIKTVKTPEEIFQLSDEALALERAEAYRTEVDNFTFGDIEVDSVRNSSFTAKEALINREITKTDYVLIHEFRDQIKDNMERLSSKAKEIFLDIWF